MMICRSRLTGSASRIGIPLGLICTLLAAGLYVAGSLRVDFREGFDRAGSVYIALFHQSWAQHGFLDTLGVPSSVLGPGALSERVPYLHHPLLGFWIYELGARGFESPAFRFRMVPCLLVALTSVLIWWLCHRSGLRRAAVVAPIVYLTWPLVMGFGNAPHIENVVPPISVWFVASLDRWRTRGSTLSGFGVILIFALGCLADWPFFFLWPGVAIVVWVWKRSWQLPACLLGLGVAAVAGLVGQMALATGSLDTALRHLREGASSASVTFTTQSGSLWTMGDWLHAQAKFVSSGFTWTGFLMAGIGFAGLYRARQSLTLPFFHLLMILIIQGIASVVFFPNRSINHPYFWMQLAAPLAMSVGIVWELAGGPHSWARGRVVPGLVAMILVTQVAYQGWQGHRARIGDGAPIQRELAGTASRLFADDVILTSPESSIVESILFSEHRWTPLVGVDHLKLLISLMRKGELGTTGIVFVATKPYLEAYFPDWGRAIEALARAESAAYLGNDGLVAWVFR